MQFSQKLSSSKNHLALKTAEIPETVLLSGDPKRIKEMGRLWDSFEVVGNNREFFTIAGQYRGQSLAACSTGIGGPSAEIAVVELFQRGARNLIRVGTSGGLSPKVKPGDIVITSSCIRETGAADAFVSRSYPAAGSHEILLALIEACSGQSINYHVGIGVTVDSFYATKPHLISEKSIPSLLEPELTVWEKSGALHMEMENAVVFVLSSLLGIRAGSICTVGSNLLLGERPDKAPSDRPAMEAACLAALILKKWDKPAESGNRSFSPRPMS